MLPVELQALIKQWRTSREQEQQRHAELLAALYNVPLQVGFNPPRGKVWLAEMLLPGYADKSVQQSDWRRDRDKLIAFAMMNRKPPTREERREKELEIRVVQDRLKEAERLRAEGAPRERLIEMMATGV